MIAPQARLSCRVLTGYHELQALRASWQALCDRCPACTPFQRPDWLLPWVQCLGPTEPWILVVHSTEHLVDRLIACLYGFFEARTLCFYLSGFDPAAAHLSPGTLIVGMVIEDAIERGMTRFDFLRGSEPYKYWWGATDRVNVRVCLRWSGAADAVRSPEQLTPGAGTGADSAPS